MRFVESSASNCGHKSADDYVRALIEEEQRRKDEREKKFAALKKDIAIGIEQLDRGEGKVYTKETLSKMFDEIKAEGRKRLAAKKKTV